MISRLWPLMIGACALGLDAYILAGLLPKIASDLSTSPSMVGTGVALFTAVYAITAPTLSCLASIYSTRTTLLIGLSIFIFGNIMTLFSPSIALFLISRGVAGIGAGIYSPLAVSSAAGMVKAEQKGRALALVLAGLSIGTAIGVPVGLLMATVYGWRVTISLITLLGLIAMVGVLTHPTHLFPPAMRVTWKDRFFSLRTPFTLMTLGVTILTAISSLGLYTYLATIVAAQGYAEHISLFMGLWGLGGMVGALYVGGFIDKKTIPSRGTLMILCLLAASLMLVFIGNLFSIAVGCFLWGVAGWSSIAPQQHSLLTHSDKNDSTTLIAWNSSMNYLGGSLGALAGAILLHIHLAADWMPMAAVIISLLAIVLHLIKSIKFNQL